MRPVNLRYLPSLRRVYGNKGGRSRTALMLDGINRASDRRGNGIVWPPDLGSNGDVRSNDPPTVDKAHPAMAHPTADA
jgi:hypothetical protein